MVDYCYFHSKKKVDYVYFEPAKYDTMPLLGACHTICRLEAGGNVWKPDPIIGGH